MKKSFTKFYNDLLEALMVYCLTLIDIKMLLFIWRMSEGCGGGEWAYLISRDFTAIGIYEPYIKRHLVKLEACNVIIHDYEKKRIRINTNFTEWKLKFRGDVDRYNRIISRNLSEHKGQNYLPNKQNLIGKLLKGEENSVTYQQNQSLKDNKDNLNIVKGNNSTFRSDKPEPIGSIINSRYKKTY